MKEKRIDSSRMLVILCWAAYSAAYIGRLNYSASIVEVIAQTGATKEAAGMVSSFFFFAYGAGQLINGLLCKKYNTRFSVSIALLGSGVSNFAMTLCPGVGVMRFVWLVNGVFQSILWSSVIKTVSEHVPDKDLPNAVVIMSTPMAVGTLLAYGLAALMSALKADYRVIFYFTSAMLIVIGIVWFVRLGALEKCEDGTQAPAVRTQQFRPDARFVFGALVILLAAIANGFIKDGVTTWTPSILTEDFGVGKSLSIILTLILPLFSIFGAALVKVAHQKIPNANVLDGIFFTAGTAVLVGALLTLPLRSTVLTMVLFCASAGLMSAVNNLITSVVPVFERERMDSGMLAGVLDTFCYVGSTMSTGLLGRIADRGGWNDVFICLVIFCAVACVLSWIGAAVGKKGKKT